MQRIENYVTMDFLSRSNNEGFMRVAAAGFAAQLDPTLEELKGDQTAGAYRKGKLGTWPGRHTKVRS